MPKKVPVNGFKWVKQEKLSNFNKDFIKNYDKSSDKGYFLLSRYWLSERITQSSWRFTIFIWN